MRVFPLMSRCLSTAAEPKINKELLMKLRRKTGYSFMNCRKAMVEFGDDLKAAEHWLHKLAQQQGWEKATKLSNRHAAQGLVGVIVEGNVGAMVEVNCETDFVSRNEKFHALVGTVANCALQAAIANGQPAMELKKWDYDVSELSKANCTLEDSSNTQLGDFVAFNIGQLGEKLNICRATCISAQPDIFLAGYTHPRGVISSNVAMGQLGTLVALHRNEEHSNFPTDTLASQLCQHVVAMNPTSLGSMPTLGNEAKQTEEQDSEDERAVTMISDEKRLLRQDFLLHPDVSVGHYLMGHGAVLLDYVRFKCGETQDDD